MAPPEKNERPVSASKSAVASSVSIAARQLNVETINARVIKAQYAVRGELVLRSIELENELLKQRKPNYDKTLPQHPFNKVVFCNIGNPQALGQTPLTFPRQILAILNYPQLLENPASSDIFPRDVIDRSKELLKHVRGGVGAYSHSKGVLFLRQTIADYISRRDGFACDPESLYLTDGASSAVHNLLRLLLGDSSDGILAPIPQYPLYSAAIALNGGTLVGYYLDESDNWGLSENILEQSISDAARRGVNIKAIVVINPGNPTGQCLSESAMRMILLFCEKYGLLLIADEVYQENIWIEDRKFVPFRKLYFEMRRAAANVLSNVSLASLHSVSKGYFGECGRRGGYMQVENFDSQVSGQLYKLASISLCSNIEGQVMVSLMSNPPRAGDDSFPLFEAEKRSILESLKRRSELLAKAYNAMEGVTCNLSQGALYVFPRVRLPPLAVLAAIEAGKQPDMFYCLQLLEETGIVVVPGSGFGQEDGTYHFRAAVLPPEHDIEEVCMLHDAFHRRFMDKYRSTETHTETGAKDMALNPSGAGP